jgi:hypothetical protein
VVTGWPGNVTAYPTRDRALNSMNVAAGTVKIAEVELTDKTEALGTLYEACGPFIKRGE